MPNQRYVNHRCQREQRTKNGNNRLVILLSVNVLTRSMDLAHSEKSIPSKMYAQQISSILVDIREAIHSNVAEYNTYYNFFQGN